MIRSEGEHPFRPFEGGRDMREQHGSSQTEGGQTGETPRDPDQTNELIESLRADLAAASEARDEATAKAQRVLADFQNYQRRALASEREALEQGRRDVVRGILTVLDHFDLALSHDASAMSVEQLLDGVRAIRAELMKVLQGFGASVISPAAGEEFEPGRHEAVMQQAAAGVAPGRIAATLQAGYMLGDRVVRPAKVAVTPSIDGDG